MPRGSRSAIQPTDDEWSSRVRCRSICKTCWTTCSQRAARRDDKSGYMAIVFKGRVFSVDVMTIHLPDGREHQVEIVRHSPSVVIVPMKDANHVVLIRQLRPSINRELWELPAGSVDEGESPAEAAARECEEEIGLVPDRVVQLAALFPAPGFCDEQLIFFRASGLGAPAADSTRKPDDDEDIHAEVVTLTNAKAMVARGDILDLKTAYALTLV